MRTIEYPLEDIGRYFCDLMIRLELQPACKILDLEKRKSLQGLADASAHYM